MAHDEDDDEQTDGDEPRCVHYQFAHVALRTLTFEDPRLALALWERGGPEPTPDAFAAELAKLLLD